MLGALISAGAGLVGNLIGSNAADDAAQQAWDRQKTAMKNQIQWRVQDAVKAGIHPLAALGVNPASGPPAAQIGADWGGSMAQMGQDIGRAIESGMAPEDQSAAQLMRLQLERGSLENDLLRSQIASQRMRNMQQVAPGRRFTNPDGSLVAGDNGMGSKIVPDVPGLGWVVGQPGAAQQMADNYGDMVQEFYGAGRLAQDVYNRYSPGIYSATEQADQWLGDMYKALIPEYLTTPPSSAEGPVFEWGY